ncbi:phosphoglycerate mutase family protein [Shewanella corallii]|uniref:Phosphoglycerate mutase family protein n=1 Tax=Shewanella corallii TaxID=560080 RepID=A0ABT0NBP1_9GAMM|nr:histidine phosphatase family protein [Shewanella corallii]MCL2915520.1 phosphoglycerate mutase family protein [Shewanella corallii]
MGEVFWVRHGQASFGTEDYDRLTKTGTEQARMLGEYVKANAIQFDVAVTGTLKRQLDTLNHMGISYSDQKYIPSLLANEFDFETLMQVYAQYQPCDSNLLKSSKSEYFRALRVAFQRWSQGEFSGHLEPYEDFSQRVTELRSLVCHSGHQKVLVISSGGVIATVLGQLLNVPISNVIELNLQMKNTGISRCFFNRNTMRISSFNESPHIGHHQDQYITY